ncbi:MAG: UvrD-helicase domain-containing protein [Phycisphaeraceae bacterium]|nr:UvrD-helicase domain-containing protein [Phycisphaeraceae bacterium]MCW5755307.1 UvrD-helicase domain-containing protein [Phycisphaeraceae bacterium]
MTNTIYSEGSGSLQPGDIASAPYVMILASAGSGKTYQLTTRLAALLLNGCPPDRFLASTFTRKAAGEILSRVLARLARATLEGDHRRELGYQIGRHLDATECGRTLRSVCSHINRISILTLDALLFKAARCAGLNLEAPPGWRPADDIELADVQRRAIENLLREMDDDMLEQSMLLLGRGAPSRSVVQAIDRSVSAAHRAMQESIRVPWAWEVVGSNAPPAMTEAINSAHRTIEKLCTDGVLPDRMATAARKLVEHFLMRQWKTFVKSTLAKVVSTPNPSYYRALIPDELQEAIRTIRQFASASLLHELHGENRATRDLTARYDLYLAAAKQHSGLYAFDDVPSMLLADQMSFADMQYRMDTTIDHVLLDEFQDTSREQFAFLEPMLDELISSDSWRTVMCVGDMKQSLYAWRRADPEVMEHVSTRWPGLKQMQLLRSYRSSQAVLDFINQVFLDLSANTALSEWPDVAEAWGRWFRAHEPAVRLQGHVRIAVASPYPERANSTHDREACYHLAVDRCLALHRMSPQASVGILLREKKGMARLFQMLRAQGLDVSLEGGGMLADAPSVLAALSLLHLAEHPGDTLAFFHVATSPFANLLDINDPIDFSHAPVVSRQVSRWIARDGLERTLMRLYPGVSSGPSSRNSERFLQLVELAGRMESRPPLALSVFIDAALSTRVESPSPAAIRVMTIHTSKGLEFDAVILPELFIPFIRSRRRLLIDREHALGEVRSVTWSADQDLTAADDRLAAITRNHQAREVRDELSTLYVALTRAAHAIELIFPPPRTKTKSAARLTPAAVISSALHLGESPSSEQVLYESGDPMWHTTVPAAQPPPAAEPITLRLAEATTPRTSRLARVTPSQIASTGASTLSYLFQADYPHARTRGVLWHAWLAQIAWLDEGIPDSDALRNATETVEVEGLDIELELRAFYAALHSATFEQVLRRARYLGFPGQLSVFRERPFSIRLPDESAILAGRIDRLVVARGADGAPLWAEVLDFKTDLSLHPSAAADTTETYRPQIDAYRHAAASLFRLPQAKVAATLVFPSTGNIIELHSLDALRSP